MLFKSIKSTKNNEMKQVRTYLLLTLCLILSSCSTKKLDAPIIIDDLATLDRTVDNLFAESDLIGFSCLAIKDGDIVYQKDMGFADLKKQIPFTKTSVQNIASISKTIIAVALMKAVDQGKINLDADINDYLPFNVTNPNHPNTPITARQLATHSSTILDTDDYFRSYYFPNATSLSKLEMSSESDEYLEMIKTNELIDESTFLKNVLTANGKWYSDEVYSKHEPGSVSEYSNIASTLAGFVIESTTGMSYEKFTTEFIFKPLGMTQTSWDYKTTSNDDFVTRYFTKTQVVPNYYLITKADGGLYTSTNDFSLFMIEMINGYKDKGTILSKESYDTMFSNQFTHDNGFSTGIFWDRDKDGGFKHDGGDPGVTTIASYNDTKDRGLIFYTNIDDNETTIPQISNIWNTIGRYDF